MALMNMVKVAICNKLLVLALVVVPVILLGNAPAYADSSSYATWIAAMKTAPRGPFTQVRWFCKDGSVLPPTPYACNDRGGGTQHGEWTDQVRQLRQEGYYVANLLAGLEPNEFLANPDHLDRFAQITLEQYLVAVDDGWILRNARYYRGALQAEAERRGGSRLLFRMAESREYMETRYLMLRTAAKLIVHGPETDEVTGIRQTSADLARQDPGFQKLRNKIHIQPQLADAEAVGAYAQRAPAPLVAEYEALAALIQRAYQPSGLVDYLDKLATKAEGAGDLASVIGEGRDQLLASTTAQDRFEVTAKLLPRLRERLLVPNGPALRMALVDATIKVEAEHYISGTVLRESLDGASRQQILSWLATSAEAVFGGGLISRRQYDALVEQFALLQGTNVPLASYKSAIDTLARVPGWGAAAYGFHFGEAVEKLSTIEPLSKLFIQDQLRSSGLFFYAQALDVLQRDATRLAGVRHELFGKSVSGIRALNPGYARGTLKLAVDSGTEVTFERKGIYVLPETVADLPPVAGIITAGEGNSLSHIQLLARNLGIPNVAIDERLIAPLGIEQGQVVVMAVSAGGSVLIEHAPPSDPAETAATGVRIVPDLNRLDLSYRGFPTLDGLKADDSGRIVGPKAAKLGELKRSYPDAVARGVVIPFGEFRQFLDRPKVGTDGSIFAWMEREYARLDQIENPDERTAQTEAFRRELEHSILGLEMGQPFEDRLRAAMTATFGAEGTYGVFVRSDTNVEDLPGFTGAGLNLTLANVVGTDAIFAGIKRVWASPFSARAFAWRQALMTLPQHVYPSVLLLETVPVEKSGVMVTSDVDTGNTGWLSIAVNEGVGGAVDGQPAEALRVETATGRVKLLAEASAPWKRTVPPTGGVEMVRASGSSRILTAAEIGILVTFAASLPDRFPAVIDAEGRLAAADVEFGFLGGQLRLFQIRPFLDNAQARNSAYLSSLDTASKQLGNISVNLNERPNQP